MKRRDFLRLAVAAVSTAMGCNGSEAPAEPVWGKEPCAQCGMVLSDKRFGGQAISNAGDRLYFDDVGCMVLSAEEHGPFARTWVRDATTGRWSDALAARYEVAAGSPMDFGFDARSGGSFDWAGIRARVLEKSRRLP